VGSLVSRLLTSSPGEPLPESTRQWIEPHVTRVSADVPLHRGTEAPLELRAGRDSFEAEADRFADRAVVSIPSAAPGTAKGARKTDLSAVRVHANDAAAKSAKAINAAAYTAGNNIVFGAGRYAPQSARGRWLLAHELAHVVQQNRGSVSPSIQRYTEFSAAEQTSGNSLGWRHPAGTDLRVSDDGFLACEDNGWGEGLSKRAWTIPAKVDESNKVLAAQGSRAELRLKGGGQEVSGTAPETRQAMKLQEIEPSKTGGGSLDLASDCGSACRQVTGSGPAGKRDVAVVGGGTAEASGTVGGVLGGLGGLLALGAAGAGIGYLAGGSDPKSQMLGLGIGAAIGGIAGLIGGAFGGSALEKKIKGKATVPEQTLTPRSYHGGDPTTPEQWSEELFKKEFGADLTREEAYQAYANLSPEDKDKFDRKYRINKYAVPKVGQGITISTEKDMPGFKRVSGFTWNFHYAADVLSSGHDYITLENAAGWAPTGWILFMYGPESKKQSFYEFQGATRTHGSKYTALVVEPEK